MVKKLLCRSVDWWSFGILIYELLYGFTPFRGKKRDETFENILKRPLSFPEQPEVSEECKVRGLGDCLSARILHPPAALTAQCHHKMAHPSLCACCMSSKSPHQGLNGARRCGCE